MANDMWLGMTKKRWEEAHLEIVTIATNIMGLGDWRIKLGKTPCDDESLARCAVTDHTQEATISVHKDWANLDDRLRRQTIFHELIHCHMNSFQEAIEAAKAPLGVSGELWWEVVRQQMELVTDNIAVAWEASCQ